MPWLDDIDLRAAAATRRSLAGRPSLEEVREAALDALARLIGADTASWDQVRRDGAVADHRAWPAEAAPERHGLSLGLHPAGEEAVVVGLTRADRVFSVRDRDLVALLGPAIEGALHQARARRLAAAPPPGTAVVLLDGYGEIEHSSLEAERWLAEHFGAAEHPGWLPRPVASWLALPPRPPLVSVRGDRRLSVTLVPGAPHVLVLEESHSELRPQVLTGLGLSRREREVLEAARVLGDDEAALAAELFLSVHAVHGRLERAEARLGVRTGSEAIAAALRASASPLDPSRSPQPALEPRRRACAAPRGISPFGIQATPARSGACGSRSGCGLRPDAMPGRVASEVGPHRGQAGHAEMRGDALNPLAWPPAAGAPPGSIDSGTSRSGVAAAAPPGPPSGQR